MQNSFKVWFESDATVVAAFVVTLVLGLVALLYLCLRSRPNAAGRGTLPTPQQTLHLLQNRRTIAPKEFDGDSLTDLELNTLLEAANWAPTHGMTEPWRYVAIGGEDNILRYMSFLDQWYVEHADTLSEAASEKFRAKFDGLVKVWPQKVSHLLLICMKRQAREDKLMPEWEELSAVAMSVQNIHLMATALGLGCFWSSHTWCKDARESVELKEHFGFEARDKILGCLVLGRYDTSKKYTSTRGPVLKKVQFRTD